MQLRPTIRCNTSAAILAMGLICLVGVRAAAEIKVIANPGLKMDTISPGEIKKIFLLETNFLGDGTHVVPVLQKSGQTHEYFLKQFLETSDDGLRLFYGSLVFAGKGSVPKELGSDAAMVSYVSKTKGAIGYVDAESSTEGVKVISITRGGKSEERRLIKHVEPDYPEVLKQRGITGTVRLTMTISPKGNVESVRLLGGNPVLADSAMAAAKLWIYSAGHSQTTVEVSIPFDGR